MEGLTAHLRRLGRLPPARGTLIDALERSDLRGKGGAGFPVATKWRTVGSQRAGTPVVIANGGEGEPLSRKDRMLMEQRPHLVIDGALLAAGSSGRRRCRALCRRGPRRRDPGDASSHTERPLSDGHGCASSAPRSLRLRRGDGGCALHQRGHRTADIHPATPVRARRRWAANARAERGDTCSRRAHRTFRRRVVSIAGTSGLPRARRWSPSAVPCHRPC